MRVSADWQVLLDDRILELFEEGGEDTFLSPSEISGDNRIRFSSQYIASRCRKLADHGLLQRVSNSVYRITDEGRAYLAGEYDVEAGAYLENESDIGTNIQADSNEEA